MSQEKEKTSGVKVVQLPVPCLNLGEGPHWQEEHQALLFVDIFSKVVRRHFVNTGRTQVLHVDDGSSIKTLSMMVPVEGTPDLYIVGYGNTLSLVTWRTDDPDTHTVAPTIIVSVAEDKFNDGKCDPHGRLWAGSLGAQDEDGELIEPNVGVLYRLDHDLTLVPCVDKVSASNGLAWSLDKKTQFYIDSDAYAVFAFDYDDANGSICNRRTLVDYKKAGLTEDIPDGMTSDIDGNLWVANFFGSKVICVDSVTGAVKRQIKLPSKCITSVCWGGPEYSTLYVTSAKMRMTSEDLQNIPAAGGTFAITGLGTKGFPPNKFKCDLNLLKTKLKV